MKNEVVFADELGKLIVKSIENKTDIILTIGKTKFTVMDYKINNDTIVVKAMNVTNDVSFIKINEEDIFHTHTSGGMIYGECRSQKCHFCIKESKELTSPQAVAV